MDKQSFSRVLIAVVLAVVAAGGVLVRQSWPNQGQKPAAGPELTKGTALSLLGMECSSEKVLGEYSSCIVDISKEQDRWTVTLTYDGLYDDSIRAKKVETTITYKDNQWVKGDIIQIQQCQQGRGHQDFSAEPCI